MMISIFERDFEKEYEELKEKSKDFRISDEEFENIQNKFFDDRNFQISLKFFENILIRRDELEINGEELKKDLNYIFEEYKNNEYIQKFESESENLSLNDYIENLFNSLMKSEISLRDIF